MKSKSFSSAFLRVGILLLGALSLFGIGACFDDEEGLAGPGDEMVLVEPEFYISFGLTLRTPGRIALSRKERLLVSDYFQGLVFGVDPVTLLPDDAFIVQGRPMAVAQIKNRILVGNASKKAIEVYGRNGRHRGYFGSGPGSVDLPTDIAVDEKASLVFAVDGGRKVIQVFNGKGALLRTLRGFMNPVGIALDPKRREILVSDNGVMNGEYSRVLIFDYDGSAVGEISGKGSCHWFRGCSGGFSTPQGVAVDDQGRVFVVDSFLGQVLVFDRDSGEMVGHLGEFGEGPGQLLVPLDVVISSSGNIFVSSSGTGRVEVFDEGGIVQ